MLRSQQGDAGEQTYDVFISYQSADEEEAKKIGARLEKEKIGNRNIKVFLAPWDIAPSQNLVERINTGLNSAKFFLLLLSPDAVSANWPTAERAAAIISDPAGRLGRVIPILIRSCKIPPLLAFRIYVDLRKKANYESEFTRLLCVIKGIPLPRGTTPGQSVINEGTSLLNPSAGPDAVIEDLYGNFFDVIKMPTEIWSAPTRFFDKKKVYEYFGHGNIAPPFILRDNRIFTFANLASPRSPFAGVIEDYDIKRFPVKDWLHETDFRKRLVELANDAIRSKSWQMQLDFEEKGRKYYYPLGILKSQTVDWFPHVRKSARDLIIPYRKEERIVFYRHRAVNLKFLLMGDSLFLRIEAGWIFSLDGKKLIEGRRRSILNTKINSRQRNLQVFDETRFWAWLLSEEGRTIKFDLGGQTLHVDARPTLTQIDRGIYGDWKEVPSEVQAPPDLVDVTDEDSMAEDLSGDLEEEDENE